MVIKLIRWRMVVHGAIDGFSRATVFLKCSNNNEAATVVDLFQTGTNTFHYPRRIRTDYGTENIEVARLMLNRYGVDSNPVITGRSLHNQRIERLWKDVFQYVIQTDYNSFYFMESQDILDPTDEVNSLALQLIYMPQINRALDYFSSQCNNHSIALMQVFPKATVSPPSQCEPWW